MIRSVVGETIKDFKLVARLGKGGMGEVWLGEQQIVKTQVAIKLLLAEVSTDTQQVQRFFNEAIAVSKIKHAGIVKIFDVGFTGRTPPRAFLVMELLEGDSIAQRIARMGRLPLAQVVDITRQIASVLEATHAAGITHRDLKPDNIFVVPDAELASKERVKVLDFGIAKLGGTDATGLTASSSSLGTPAYMAPEQWNNAASADARADIYALGCLVFEMCCGRPPFIARSVGEACTKHLTETPPRARTILPTLPDALDELIARMLEKAPADRPSLAEVTRVIASVAAHAATLDATLDSSDIVKSERPAGLASSTTLTAAAAEQAKRPAARRGGRYLIGGLVAVALAGGGYLATRSPSDTAAQAPPPPAASTATPVALKEPVLGLETLARFADPKDESVSDLKSESLWTAAREDFAEACKQPGAPVRWCAAVDFTEGQAILGKDLAGATAKFRAAIARDASFALAHVALAGTLSTDGKLDEALAAARAAQRLEPKSWVAVAVGARAYSAAGNLDESIGEFRRALVLAPDNPVLMAEAALAYHAAGMDAEADRLGGEALKRVKTLFALQLRDAERKLEQGKGAEALEAADRALASAPKAVQAHLARGDALQMLKREADAMAAYKRAVELDAARPTPSADARMKDVSAAVGKNQLPPARGKRDRTRPDQIKAKIPRSRPRCSSSDPLCGTNLIDN